MDLSNKNESDDEKLRMVPLPVNLDHMLGAVLGECLILDSTHAWLMEDRRQMVARQGCFNAGATSGASVYVSLRFFKKKKDKGKPALSLCSSE